MCISDTLCQVRISNFTVRKLRLYQNYIKENGLKKCELLYEHYTGDCHQNIVSFLQFIVKISNNVEIIMIFYDTFTNCRPNHNNPCHKHDFCLFEKILIDSLSKCYTLRVTLS